jgi:hypothetical protein
MLRYDGLARTHRILRFEVLFTFFIIFDTLANEIKRSATILWLIKFFFSSLVSHKALVVLGEGG